MKIRSKHNNLLNYFIHDRRDLSPAYVRSCEKFFKEISHKRQATSDKRQATSDKPQAPRNKLDKQQAIG
tara:strand:+ start:344 stop:550 length:207 start_codon:yes stop_codon:yes gene_type:complete